MATERIQIIVSSKGTVTIKKEIEDIGTASKKTTNGVDMLRSALGTIAAALSIERIIAFADAGTRIANSLKVAGLEGENFARTQDRLYKTAIKNGQSTEALAAVYQKTSLVQKELGITGEGVIDAVEGIAAAMKLSTAGTNAQEGALQQLSQLLGGSIVQAQEYNSLIDGAFPLVQAAARGIDGMGGSVAKLTQAVKEGGFSSKVFFEGMMKGLQDTKALAASLPLTVGQSIVALQQAFIQWLNSSTLVQGAMSALAMILNLMAQNMTATVVALTPLIAALVFLAGEFVIGLVVAGFTGMATIINTQLIPAVTKLTALLWANPYILLAAAIAAVVAAIIYWRKELGITDKLLNDIWQVGVAAWNAILEAATELGTYFAEQFAPIIQSLNELWNTYYIYLEQNVFPIMKAIWEYVEPALKAWLEGVGFILGKWVELNTFLGGVFIKTVQVVFEGMLYWVDLVIKAVTTLIDWFNKAIALAKTLAGLGGGGGDGGGGGGAKAAGMREGGQFTVGGTGSGTDTTPVRFNANRGERVTVETRKQQRQADNSPGGAGAGDTNVKVPVSITNVFDPSMIPAAMETAAGQRAIVNALVANRDEINYKLGVA